MSKNLERKLENTFFNAMLSANKAILEAGRKGEEFTGTENPFKEQQIYADKLIHDAVVRSLEHSGMPIGLYTEESGEVIQIGNSSPEYVAALDEQDGFGLWIEKGKQPSMRYGTMLSIMKGDNPRWSDTLIGGTIEHAPQTRIFYGSKLRNGSFVRSPNGDEKQIKASTKKTLDEKTKIWTDRWFGTVNVFFDYPFQDFGAADVGAFGGSEAGYVDVATGDAHALGECTRKRNLEPATSYSLVRNAGAQIYAIRGSTDLSTSLELEDVGNWEYILTAEQAKLQRIPLLTVCTPELAEEMVAQIQKHYDWGGPLIKGKVNISE